LPCLGIGTPVLYVEDQQQAETSYCRLDGLRELFHILKCDGEDLSSTIFTAGKITQNFIFENKPDYKPLADNLIDKCSNFVRESR
jgi:hypothetical protein